MVENIYDLDIAYEILFLMKVIKTNELNQPDVQADAARKAKIEEEIELLLKEKNAIISDNSVIDKALNYYAPIIKTEYANATA
jgi:hypothetical protein